MTRLGLALLLMAASLTASAQYVDFHGNSARHCPDKDPNVSWVDYISGTKTPIGNMAGNPYSIIFKFAKEAGGKEAIGGLASNQCYGGAFVTRPAGSYPHKGYSSDNMNVRGSTMHGLDGDPLNFEINVQGRMFHYSDLGVLYNATGKRVGVLVCYVARDCTAY